MAFRESVVALFSKFTLTTKCIGILTIIMYILSFIPGSKILLSITPGYLMPPKLYVWTLLTFIFFDDHFYCVIVNLVTLVFSNNLLEPLWGQQELLKYLLIVSVMSGLICFFTCYFLYLFTYFTKILFETHIHGMIAFAAAVTVAVRQTLPDDVIMTLPIGNVKNTHLSFIGVIFTIILSVLHIVEFVYPLLFCVGIIVSWTYLRFYQKHSNGCYGDHSDSFEFAGFFPNHLKPPVSILSNGIFSLLVRFRICKKMERQLTVNPVAVLSSVSKDPVESQRRKDRALQALNDRLTRSGEPTPWPSVAPDASQTPEAVAEAPVEPAKLTDQEPSVSVSINMPGQQKTLTASELKHLPLPDFKMPPNVTTKTSSPTRAVKLAAEP